MDSEAAFDIYCESLSDLYAEQVPGSAITLGLDSLGVDHWPAWQELVESLPRDRGILVGIANMLAERLRIGESLAFYKLLSEQWPEDPQIHHNLGSLLRRVGDCAGAIQSFRRVLLLDPSWADTGLALAHLILPQNPDESKTLLELYQDEGPQFYEAERLRLRLRLRENPFEVDSIPVEHLENLCDGSMQRRIALLNLLLEYQSSQVAPLMLSRVLEGMSEDAGLQQKLFFLDRYRPGDHAEREALLKALERDYDWKAEVLLLLGHEARRQRRFDAALAYASRAIEKQTHPFEAQIDAAADLFSLGRKYEALVLYQKCAQIQPLNVDLCRQLALLHYAMGRPCESRYWMLRTLRLLPRAGVDAWCTCAHFLRLQGNFGDALNAADEAVRIDSEDFMARNTRAFMLLQQGRYSEAWGDYEYRIHPAVVNVSPPDDLDRWDGVSELDDLVLIGEQGVGDLVQFMRYVPFLHLAIPRISVLVDQRLCSLMKLAGVFSAVYVYGEPVLVYGKAAWLPILSVPGLLGITPDCVLIDQPYLSEPEAPAKNWNQLLRSSLGTAERLVGLHWQGSPPTETTSLAGRSIPLTALEPLMSIPNLSFVSLQKGPGSEQLDDCHFRDRFVAAQPEVDACWDYCETVSMIAACDRVITSDSGVAHLAGALGCSVWLLLPYIPEWRWGLEGSTSPWYPTMRIFRQPVPGDWASVISNVRQALLEEQMRS